MKVPSRRGRAAQGLIVIVLAGCGGGGGGTPPTTPPPGAATVTALKSILLDPLGAGVAGAGLRVHSTGQVELTVTAEPAWVDLVTAVLLRRGSVAAPGAVLADFVALGGTFDPVTRSLSGAAALDAATAVEIATTPASFHLAIVTSGPPSFAGGPLAPFAPALAQGRLADDPAASFARCVFTAAADPDGHVSWVLAVAETSVAAVTGLEIDEAGSPFPPLVLAAAGAVRNAAHGTMRAEQTFPLHRLLRILARPTSFTLTMQTSGVGAPSLAGPLETAPLDVVAPLRGTAGPLTSAGLTLRLLTATEAIAVVAVPGNPAPSLDGVAAVEVVEGPVAAPGAVLFDVKAAADLALRPDHRSGQGTVAADQELMARMVVDPAAFHARVVPTGSPNVLASDLADLPPRFFTRLDGTGVIHEGQSGSGAADVWVTSADSLRYSIEAANPEVDPATLQGAVAHAVGTTPTTGARYDLLATPLAEQVIEGNVRSGAVTVSSFEVAALLAQPGAIALSLTTVSAPNGVAEGSLRDGSPCEAKYIPPFEGVWTDGSNLFNLHRTAGLTGCGEFSGTGQLGSTPVSMTGTYVADQVDVTVSNGTESAHYEGTVLDVTTTDAVTTLPTRIQASHGSTHGLYGDLWLSGADYTLVFTTYPPASLQADPVAGYLTCCGVKIPFTGTEDKGDFDLVLDLVGVDLTPCPALAAAWAGLDQASLSGGLTNGIGQVSIDGPINTVFDRPNR